MTADRLSATFAALADPTRRAILARVATGETSVSELARPFDMSLPAISKHLKVLERAGLGGAMAAVPIEGGAVEGRGALDRQLSAALGAPPGSTRRLPA